MPRDPVDSTTLADRYSPAITITGHEGRDGDQWCVTACTESIQPAKGLETEELIEDIVGTLYSDGAFEWVSKKSISYDSNPGAEYVFRSNGVAWPRGQFYAVRVYWIAPRVYVIGIGGPLSGEFYQKRNIFLDSFTVVQQRSSRPRDPDARSPITFTESRHFGDLYIRSTLPGRDPPAFSWQYYQHYHS